MSKRKHFKCKSQAQVYAIRRSYAERQEKERLSNNIDNSNDNSFKLPLKSGEHTWNIYRVPNSILNGKQDNNVHGGLVLDEINDNVMLVEVTHSKKDGKRNNVEIRNLKSNDVDENGELRKSYLKRNLVVSYKKGELISPINVSILLKQMNDLYFTEDEKQIILDKLSNLSTAVEKYNLFENLSKEKKSDT